MSMLLATAFLASVLVQAGPVTVQGALDERGEVIVQLGIEAHTSFEQHLAGQGLAVVGELPELDLLLVDLPAGRSVEATVQELAHLPGVVYAEPNGMGQGGELLPNDTYFSEQWSLRNTGMWGGVIGGDIEAAAGWRLTEGSPDVIVAVLDSGFWTPHPDFTGRILPGHDFYNADANPHDDHGHGTAVTGILAANADNAFSLAGVDHACKILPVKVLNRNNGGSLFALTQGLIYSANAGADVISMSLINYPTSVSLNNALIYAREAGCILVSCAGNGGPGDADWSLPGRSPLVISVGATTRYEDIAWYSGTGAALDVVAPGDDVPASMRMLEDTYGGFGGCSAATPVVSGICALALSIDPTLTHDEMAELLYAGAEDQVGPVGSDLPGRDDQFGHGRVNLFRTLCGLDAGGPAILGPAAIHVECTKPGGYDGADPTIVSALQVVTADDDLDPEPSLERAALPFLALGKTVQVAFTSRDACGHVNTRAIPLLVEDTTAPLVTAELALHELDPASHTLVDVGLAFGAQDACDLTPLVEVRVFCDEPVPERRFAAALDDDGGLALRGDRDDLGDGRVYLVLVRARDDFGNAGVACTSAVVPLDAGDPDGVLAQADAAVSQTLATGEPPAGFTQLAAGFFPREERRSHRARH